MKDMWNKKRHPVPKKGTNRKLSSTQINDVRSFHGKLSGEKCGYLFGVSGQTILNIWNKEYGYEE